MKQIQEISAKEAYTLVQEGAVLLDVREGIELAELSCDVSEVLNIPIDTLEKNFSLIPKEREIITICRSGGRSAVATLILVEQGFENVKSLQGGIIAWEDEGLPIK